MKWTSSVTLDFKCWVMLIDESWQVFKWILQHKGERGSTEPCVTVVTLGSPCVGSTDGWFGRLHSRVLPPSSGSASSSCPLLNHCKGLACKVHTNISTLCGSVVILPNRDCLLKEEGVETYGELSFVKWLASHQVASLSGQAAIPQSDSDHLWLGFSVQTATKERWPARNEMPPLSPLLLLATSSTRGEICGGPVSLLPMLVRQSSDENVSSIRSISFRFLIPVTVLHSSHALLPPRKTERGGEVCIMIHDFRSF